MYIYSQLSCGNIYIHPCFHSSFSFIRLSIAQVPSDVRQSRGSRRFANSKAIIYVWPYTTYTGGTRYEVEGARNGVLLTNLPHWKSYSIGNYMLGIYIYIMYI